MGQYTLKKALNFLKLKDILQLVLCIFIAPFALIAKIFIRDFWLVCEEKNEARDNGYWLYKWIRENHPEQKIAYAINKKSPDYDKVKDLGKTISYGTLSHWFWYIVADKNISSQKGGKPNAKVCYLFEVILKMRKNNRIFLQHGVIINVLEWLFYKNTQMRLFITSSIYEYEFVSNNFGYPKGYVQMCGLPRFDALHDAVVDEDLILMMPTWRSWLGRESHDNKNMVFEETQYFQAWSAFLNSPELDSILTKYNKKLLFYPHRNMQKFIQSFSTQSRCIEIADWQNYDVQDLLKRASLLITDYSSVFFDFAYMRKPVIFYQFDEAEFREKQYAEGYFDYHDTVLGKWADTQENVLAFIEKQLQNGCARIDEEIIKQFFPLWDTNNCKRNYESIMRI